MLNIETPVCGRVFFFSYAFSFYVFSSSFSFIFLFLLRFDVFLFFFSFIFWSFFLSSSPTVLYFSFLFFSASSCFFSFSFYFFLNPHPSLSTVRFIHSITENSFGSHCKNITAPKSLLCNNKKRKNRALCRHSFRW